MLFVACKHSRKSSTNIVPLDLFKTIITGNFNNSRQVASAIAAGKQLHPLARHINRIADDKIDGLPASDGKKGFWVIEESYYDYPGKPTEIKPFLFHFSEGEPNTVLLKVYQFPAALKKEEIKNDNTQLRLHYADLKPSPSFPGAVYYFDKANLVFKSHTVTELGNGMRFTLTETLSTKQLIVMELLEKDGKSITPYSTPITYDRE